MGLRGDLRLYEISRRMNEPGWPERLNANEALNVIFYNGVWTGRQEAAARKAIARYLRECQSEKRPWVTMSKLSVAKGARVVFMAAEAVAAGWV